MIFSKRLQIIILLIGDLALFYAALLLTLAVRYRFLPFAQKLETPFSQIWDIHKWPFLYVHLLWLLIFYISGLYDIKSFPSPKILLSRILKTMAVAGPLGALIFYAAPSFQITPKTNLFMDVVFAAILLMAWRRFFWLLLSKISKTKVVFFGKSKEAEGLDDFLKINVQMGYEPAIVEASPNTDLANFIKKNRVQLIVASKNAMENSGSVRKLYEALPLGVSIVDFPTFYETVEEKIPVSVINESWFLINLVEIHKQLFEIFKRAVDVFFSIILAVPTLILFPFIAAFSKIESRDDILARQLRIGKNGKPFMLIKFRSMYHASEIDGKAKWAEEKDARITKIGNILRKTRMDELPQLWNIFKGEMSFIGPRPERPEFVSELQKQIPHYAMRHLVKPGISGWAQIRFPYGASVEDAMEKLQYDLYYIKNRSVVLDMAIALRTIATIIRRQGR